VFSWFKSKKEPSWFPPLTTDVHSHLLPGIDDGVKTIDESLSVIQRLRDAGFSRIITSPHIHELYRNTEEVILEKLAEVKSALEKKDPAISISTIAEYNLDEWLMNRIEQAKPLLTFADKYLLFETNFFSEPLTLNEFIFKVASKGYKPVMAHPERYMYLINNKSRVEDLISRGVLFQLNTVSLAGAYGPNVERLAKFLIDNKYVHLIGSDCHNLLQAELLHKAMKTKYYHKVLSLPLLNYSI
jgi:protein-tyrosine phosphatase